MEDQLTTDTNKSLLNELEWYRHNYNSLLVIIKSVQECFNLLGDLSPPTQYKPEYPERIVQSPLQHHSFP